MFTVGSDRRCTGSASPPNGEVVLLLLGRLESFPRVPTKVYRGWKAFFVCLYIVVAKLQRPWSCRCRGRCCVRGHGCCCAHGSWCEALSSVVDFGKRRDSAQIYVVGCFCSFLKHIFKFLIKV